MVGAARSVRSRVAVGLIVAPGAGSEVGDEVDEDDGEPDQRRDREAFAHDGEHADDDQAREEGAPQRPGNSEWVTG